MNQLMAVWKKIPEIPRQILQVLTFGAGFLLVLFLLGQVRGLIGSFADLLDKSNLKKVILYNLWLVLAMAILAYLGWKVYSKRNLRESAQKLFKFGGSRIFFSIILAYFAIGMTDLVWLRVEKKLEANKSYHTEISLLDWMFTAAGTKIEKDYSAPFANSTIEGEYQLQGTHILGTDQLGNDVLYLTLKGCRTALLLAFGSSLILFPLAISLGLASGYFGGLIDDIITWLYTTVASMPFLLFIIALTIIFGKSLENIIFAFGITSWTGTCRLIRAETMKFKKVDFVTATRVLGGNNFRILFRHITPNLMHIIVIKFSMLTSHFIIAESILSFLGIGLDASSGSWGAMIARAQDELLRDPVVWWPFVSAGFLGIFPLVLSLNMFGDILRDALDPKLNADG